MNKTVLLGVSITASLLLLHAQDTRRVTEPVIPSVCEVVKARLVATRAATSSYDSLAEADERKPDTARIQRALDRCPAGQAVALKSDGSANAFLSGPIQLRAGVTLLVDKGAILFGSRDAREYDLTPGSCGIVNESGRGCKPLIGSEHSANAAVMGEGVIDGRGWAQLAGKNVSWWDLAQEAKVKNLNQNCPRLMVLSHSDNFTLYRITLKNAPMYHVYYTGGNGFTAWGVIIDTPKTARNTDGINPANATNVTITHCFIHAGDDNVAIKAGGGPSSNITVAHNHFYTGHGMSIGSDTEGGVSAVRVTDLSIDGADNGIRIKSNVSRGGLVHDIVYEDVCIRDTKNPILMDSNYSFFGKARDKFPTFADIVLRNVRVLSAGKISLDGFDDSHRLGITFDNVALDAPEKTRISSKYADITLGPGTNFRPTGESVHISGSIGEKLSPNACRENFVPMPGSN